VQATRHYLRHYTIDHGAPPAGSPPADHDTPIQQEVREIQARLDQLAPAATEVERLQDALDALRALEQS
jgi:hypothetical protein